MIVWMSTQRKGIAYHKLTPDRRTPCGRWYGGVNATPIRGLMVAEHEAREIGAECKRCYGTAVVVEPRPAKRSGWAQ